MGNLELILVASVASLVCLIASLWINNERSCEDDDFRSLPFVITQTTCPSCGREHSWSKSDAWLNEGS
jgi:hypothetical protein